MQTVINAADDCNNATEFASAINILDAIKWIHGAWKDVSQDTIMKCFRHAGFLQEATTATEDGNATENNAPPETRAVIEDISLSEEMELLPEVYRSQLPSIEAIGNFDDILEVHEDVPDTAQELLEKVLSTDDKNEESSSDEEETISVPESPPTHQRALECIKELENYAFTHGQPQIIEVLFGLERDIQKQWALSKIKKTKQCLLTDFFK